MPAPSVMASLNLRAGARRCPYRPTLLLTIHIPSAEKGSRTTNQEGFSSGLAPGPISIVAVDLTLKFRYGVHALQPLASQARTCQKYVLPAVRAFVVYVEVARFSALSTTLPVLEPCLTSTL